MIGKIGPRISATKTNMIVDHDLRHAGRRFDYVDLPLARGAGVVAQRTEFPFRIDYGAVFRRQFGFR